MNRRPIWFLAAALLGAPLCAQGSILPYLPKETLMALEVPDLDATLADFRQMPVARIWREEEVQQFVQDAMNMAKGRFDALLAQAKEMHAQGAFPVDPDKLLALRVKGGTFAVTRLDLVEGRYSPEPNIGLLLHLDFGATAKEWFGLVQMGLGMLEQQAGARMTRSEAKVGDVTVITMAPNRAGESPMSLNVAMLGSGLVIGTLAEEVRDVIDNFNKRTAVLTTSEHFKASSAKVAAQGSEMRFYLRVDPILDFALKGLQLGAKMEPGFPVDPEGVARAVDALGLRGIQSVGYTCSYENGVSVARSFIAAPAPARKGLLAGGHKNLDQGFLRWVPKDAVSFSAWTIDPMGIHDALVNALKAYDPDFAKGVLAQLGEMEKQVDFTLREDLFGAAGDTFIWWSMPLGTVTSAPEMAFLLKVNDQERIVKVMKNLSAMTQGMVEIEEGEKRGIKAYQIRVNFDPSGGMGMNVFDILSPTFAFKNGWLVGGFSASDVKRVFDRMDRADEPKGDIRGNKEFEPYLARLPKEIQSVSFSDWKAQFEGYYQMITGVLAFIPISEDVPLDMSLLPDSNTITKHLFGSVSYGKADAEGYSTTSMGPFGPELYALLGAVAGGAGAWVASMRGF